MRTFVQGEGNLPNDLATALARYRYQVFVERLGWALPVDEPNMEWDKYDREDTIYVIAREDCGSGSICGCARLLPTTRPYLLKDLFPELLANDLPPPESHDVWELSRFAASVDVPSWMPEGHCTWRVRPLLASVVQCAARLGARQLIGVTYLSMERLFRRIGVHVHRAGPPLSIDDRIVVACWIDIDEQTLSALDIDLDAVIQLGRSA
ncbi:acyl-homoserine-lactone synthase [Paraburkholderia azotifigens]|uniref:acyl-homoserine-lactone synthase n=1 Tax=Paraburkholderia azotifigens TaxID=2057004 RepID=UPI0031781DC0